MDGCVFCGITVAEAGDWSLRRTGLWVQCVDEKACHLRQRAAQPHDQAVHRYPESRKYANADRA